MTGMLSGSNIKNNNDDNSTGEFVDNYNMDCGSSDDNDFTLSEKMVHYLGGHVIPEHWTACKATLVIFAGSRTSKLTVMTKVGKEAACLNTYLAAIGELVAKCYCLPANIKPGGAIGRR
jgi:hypothetical protein